MEKITRVVRSPESLDGEWDSLASNYFQRKEFLLLLHKFNPCRQRYFCLYTDGLLTAGAVVYTLRVNLFTFLHLPSPLSMQVIGIPASVAATPMLGSPGETEYLLDRILEETRGLVLGINLVEKYRNGKVVQLRTLPTIRLSLDFPDYGAYLESLRHPYRRRLSRIEQKFEGVRTVTTACDCFSETHYKLYLAIMRRTKTKLETLGFEVFKNLPSNFTLTTHYQAETMLAWQVSCEDHDTLFFFFGGMNYALRDRFQSYQNNLLSILRHGIEGHFRMIDFGQTAEIAKTRLGGLPEERKMFIFTRNKPVFFLLKILQKALTYNGKQLPARVFRSDVSKQSFVIRESSR